ncbi:MAG TPA: c-type cytochrome [Bryobacteraceae bacterium]|jgi:cytochrome c2|nr:c-type cytochrome [Bryobacteraceae bacterium]
MKAPLTVEAFLLLAAFTTLAGCTGGKVTKSYDVAVDGNPNRGKQVIEQYGCGACHTIPGVPAARGVVGPPLTSLAQRTMLAGELPNSPANLVRWIENPSAIEPKTAMPTLGLTDSQARDVAAYLYTLR